MRRLAALLALALVSVAAACGGSVDESTPNPTKNTAIFLARTAGATGPLTGYDAGLGRSFELPGGLRSADGASYFAVRGGKLLRFDPLTGRRTRSYALDGDWSLAGVSATGDWVALTRPDTEILVLDTKSGKTTHEIALSGRFTVETISTDGDFLFLQQNFVDGRYAVRGYDLAADQMLPGSLATKGNTVFMQGLAAQTVASPDGRWLLTLYVNSKTNSAFVHALNLVDRVPLCITMPPCKKCSTEDLTRWALALGPDGRTLFAANPATGRTAEIHLPSSKVIAQSRFTPSPGGESHAAVSPDGSQFLFTNGDTVWSYDTHRGWAKPLATESGIADLGFSPDGDTLFLARKDARPIALSL
jgi:hypothetical protein